MQRPRSSRWRIKAERRKNADSVSYTHLDVYKRQALDRVAQTQVNPRIELTFARALRSILRHDPDVIIVGEIRDRETAEIAIQASLTGHLVLASLHTNTAGAAVTRMTDMGVEPYLLASSLRGVLAQRLVRKLCPQCRVEHLSLIHI